MFAGSMVAIVTPMMPDGSIDWAAWDRLLDFHLAEGTSGVVIAGTTGESVCLTFDEIIELTRRAIARVNGRIQVIVGAGSNSTHESMNRASTFSALGVDGLLAVTPYYNKPPQEGMFRHFSALADASSVPLILYNVPGRTAIDLLPATVARLARHPRIAAIKEATASVERAREIISLCPREFIVLSGDDATVVDLIAAGARGVISVTANVAPRRMAELCAAALGGDLPRARSIDASLRALHRDLFVESSPIPVKWAVSRMGLMGNGIRLPLVELSAIHHETVSRAMELGGVGIKGQAA